MKAFSSINAFDDSKATIKLALQHITLHPHRLVQWARITTLLVKKQTINSITNYIVMV